MKTLIRFHGTSWENAQKILDSGVRISDSGTLGPGFYCGPFELAGEYSRECVKRDKGSIPFLLALRIRARTIIRIKSLEDLPATVGFDVVEWENEVCVRDSSNVQVLCAESNAYYCAAKLSAIASKYSEEYLIEKTQDISRTCVDLYLEIFREFKEMGWRDQEAAWVSKGNFCSRLPRGSVLTVRPIEDEPEDHLCRTTGACYFFGRNHHVHCLVCKEPPPFPRQVKLSEPERARTDPVNAGLSTDFLREEIYVSLCNECVFLSENVERETILGISLLNPETKELAKREIEKYPIFRRWRDAITLSSKVNEFFWPSFVNPRSWELGTAEYLSYCENTEDFRQKMDEFCHLFVPGG